MLLGSGTPDSEEEYYLGLDMPDSEVEDTSDSEEEDISNSDDCPGSSVLYSGSKARKFLSGTFESGGPQKK